MNRRYPLNALRAFESAGRLGLMKLAAEELYVTHSAVSRHIQHLESVLGVRLFEGTKNAPKLTAAGRKLLTELTAAFDQMDFAVQSVAKSPEKAEGRLELSCLGTFSVRWLIPRLHLFTDKYPAIDIRLTTSDNAVNFSRDNFDVAIRVGKAPWPDDADVTLMFPEKFGPVHSPQSRGSQNGLPSSLLHTLTRPDAWADWTERSGMAIRGSNNTEYEHFYFMLEAAGAGLGMCIAPLPLVENDISSGRLIAPFDFINSGLDYVVMRRQQRNLKVSLFSEWLLYVTQAL